MPFYFHLHILRLPRYSSDIEYNLSRDDYYNKAFISLGEVGYFVEQGVEGTIISKVTDTGLYLLHHLKFRPTDSILNQYALSYESSNSGIIYEDQYLYELYYDYIYVIDILAGDIVKVIDLKQRGIRLQNDFVLGENFMYFTAITNDGLKKVRYNRLSEEFQETAIYDIRIGDDLYKISDASNRIIHHDLTKNIITAVDQFHISKSGIRIR